jgi:hypothetical protein
MIVQVCYLFKGTVSHDVVRGMVYNAEQEQGVSL